MIFDSKVPSLFLSPQKLGRLARKRGWSRCNYKEWLKIQNQAPVCSLEAVSLGSLAEVAVMNRMTLEGLEKVLKRYVEKGKKVQAVGCTDCILIHPSVVGECLWNVVLKWR